MSQCLTYLSSKVIIYIAVHGRLWTLLSIGRYDDVQTCTKIRDPIHGYPKIILHWVSLLPEMAPVPGSSVPRCKSLWGKGHSGCVLGVPMPQVFISCCRAHRAMTAGAQVRVSFMAALTWARARLAHVSLRIGETYAASFGPCTGLCIDTGNKLGPRSMPKGVYSPN